jgi:hypothetical protein
VLSHRLVRHALGAAALSAALATHAAPALAQGKLDARYTASLAGIPVGKGSWLVDIAGDQYVAAASGATAGLIQLFAGGKGTGAARGTISSAGQPVAATYAATFVYDRKADEVQMTFAGGNVKEHTVVPPVRPHPDRVPVTEAHRRGVFDPMTVMLNVVPGNGDVLSPQACGRRAPVFDGRLRFDLQSAFKRIDNVNADRGYKGPVVVCALYFSPVSGYVAGRPAMKYLSELRDAEIWFAPIAGTRVVVPFRISIPTPVGVAALQATQFISKAQPVRASTAAPRMQ